MRDHLFALVVKGEPELFESLHSTLKELSILSYTVQTRLEAARLLAQTEPQLVFTATSFQDGNWLDVLGLVEKAGVTSNVIVVAARGDLKLYLSAMDRGAFDFIVPPFESESLGYVIRSAQLDVTHRRADMMRAALA